MQASKLRNLLAGSVLGAVLASGASAMSLVPPNCLDELALKTQTWAECTQRFSRNDRRCKPSTAKMHKATQQCQKEGKSKAEIDAAMAQGFRKAGTPRPAKSS